MFGFIANILGDAVAPLVDSVTAFSVRLLRKVALFAVAGICLLVVLIALTIAFDLWIASLAGPIVGALAVAGLYLIVAVVAIVLATREDAPAVAAAEPSPAEAAAETAQPEIAAQIDQFTQPILDILARFGLRREQLAVFAGATVAKRLGPLPLVGCAIVVGFLAGRLWKSWRQILEAGLALSPFIGEMFAQKPPEPEAPDAPPAVDPA